METQDAAKLFLRALTGQNEPCATFVTLMNGEAGRPLKNAHYDDVANTLHCLNRAGADIFFVVNETDGKGRRAENITAARALWCDYDKGAPSFWPVQPSLLVQSSPGKFQAYWILSEPCHDFERWTAAQRGLNRATGGDENAMDLARVLRLPGFANCKYPSRPPVIWETQGFFASYPLELIERTWAPVAAGGSMEVDKDAAALAAETVPQQVRGTRYITWLDAAGPPPPSSSMPGASRSWLFRKAAMGVRDFALDVEVVAALLDQRIHAQKFAAPEWGELVQIVRDADRYSGHARGAALVKSGPSVEMQ